MKSFLIKSTAAFVLLFVLLLCCLLFPLGKQYSMLYALLEKHTLLERTPSPRIIFVGGSNLAFGLNSEEIAETFQMPVVNTGLHAGLGFNFIMKDIEPYIQEGDIVVTVPEYQLYTKEDYYGNQALVSLLTAVYPKGAQYVSAKQALHLVPYAMKHAATNLMLFFYKPVLKENLKEEFSYDHLSFNKYGDEISHWKFKNIPFNSNGIAKNEEIYPDMIHDLTAFRKKVEEKGATFLLLPPVNQASSFDDSRMFIDKIKDSPAIHSLNPNFNPERYRLADSLFFDTSYHMNKQGSELRTVYVIEDLSKFIYRGNCSHIH